MDRESLKLLLAQGLSLEEIGRRYGKHPSTVGYWVKRHRLMPVHGDRHAYKGGIGRDELERLVGEGLSIDRIAQHLGLGHTTVRYWLEKYGLETERMKLKRLKVEAVMTEDPVILLHCRKHGLTDFRRVGSSGRYRCRRCSSDFVSRRRRKVKRILVEEAGGECAICGYDRHPGALEFHHLDPTEKSFTIATAGVTRSLESARAEAAKCVLLCANCHSEVEAGVASVSGG